MIARRVSLSIAFTIALLSLHAASCDDSSERNGTPRIAEPIPFPFPTPLVDGASGNLRFVRLHLNHLNVTLPNPVARFFAPEAATSPLEVAADQCVLVPAVAPAEPVGRVVGLHVLLSGHFDLTLTPQFPDDPSYYFTTAPAAVWTSGGTYDVSWPGSTATNGLMAATLLSALTLPSPLVVTAPVMAPPNQGPNILLNADIPVEWAPSASPVPGENMWIEIAVRGCGPPPDNVASERIYCRPMDDGSFTVPNSILSQLPVKPCGDFLVSRLYEGSRLLDDGSYLTISAGFDEYWQAHKN